MTTKVVEYLEEHGKWMVELPEAEAADITGEGLMKAAMGAKETASGIDQWAPADLKRWSPRAFQLLAHLLNLVERGGTWPKQMKTARAAFLAKEVDNALDPLA